MKKRIAVCPGSFDPITLGHVDLVRRAARLFDELIVAVAADAEKHHRFSLDERVEMVREACDDIADVTVEGFSGLLVEFCRRQGAAAIVKGIRTTADMPHELQMQAVNADLAPEIETVFLAASAQYAHMSSTMVKWLSDLGADVSGYVPAGVALRLKPGK